MSVHGVLGESLEDRGELRELLGDLVVGHAERLEEQRHRLLALAVDADADGVALVDLKLEPRATRGDHLRGEDVLVGRLVGGALEVHARRTDELRDHDALGAVDDEGAARGHQREVAHEHRLRLDLAGGVVHELGRDEELRGEGEVLLLALLGGVARLLEVRVREGQRHGLSEVLDRGDLLEDLLQARNLGDVVATVLLRRLDPRLPRLVAEEPVEALGLQGDEVRDLDRLVDLGE
ncbi:hypothetical protein GCM10025873_26160 [Demequina sediminis]|nr:hypothetical protein GCM10025873_26160 [Demequina sediminis]